MSLGGVGEEEGADLVLVTHTEGGAVEVVVSRRVPQPHDEAKNVE